MSRQILINKQQYSSLQFDEPQLIECFQALDNFNGYAIPKGELSLVFMDNDTIGKLHDDYLDDPTPTDVITFDGDEAMDDAGEICVSVDYALEACKRFDTTFADELALYLVHGWLHLSGLDDIEEVDRQKMREGEEQTMRFLKENNKIPNFSIL